MDQALNPQFITPIATVVLAIATVVLALLTSRYTSLTHEQGHQEKQSAQAAERAARAAEKAVLVQAMPVLIPWVAGNDDEPHVLKVRNEGATSALNVKLHASCQGVPLIRGDAAIAHMEAGETVFYNLSTNDSALSTIVGQTTHTLVAEWTDPFGHHYCAEVEQETMTESRSTTVRVSTFYNDGGEWISLVRA